MTNPVLSYEELCEELCNLNPLKRGGQKAVYRADHKEYGDVVLKLYFCDDPRSQREIEIGLNAGLSAVPVIFKWGHIIYEGRDTIYVLEQMIKGQELGEKLSTGYRYSLREVVNFLEQSLRFVAQIEEREIVHRDIKPQNIILADDGTYFFLDFGIARVLNLPSLTATGALIGPHTPGYAAPEQFNNLKEQLDSRADIFSIGVVAYECITGINPFCEGALNHLDILNKTETIDPVEFSISGDTQKQLSSLVCSMMGKYPSRRPQNAEQALGWLEAAKRTFSFEEE